MLTQECQANPRQSVAFITRSIECNHIGFFSFLFPNRGLGLVYASKELRCIAHIINGNYFLWSLSRFHNFPTWMDYEIASIWCQLNLFSTTCSQSLNQLFAHLLHTQCIGCACVSICIYIEIKLLLSFKRVSS